MRYKTILLIVAVLVVGFSVQSCLKFRVSDKKQWKELKDVNQAYQIEIGSKPGGERSLHYTLVHKSYKKPLVVFVHGSPGSSSNFLNFAKDPNLLKEYNVLLVDRPGFGYSDFGKPEPSLAKQAVILDEFLDGFSYKNIVLLGHSLGGPIICRMAMDNPDKYYGLFILAGSVSADLEPIEKWRHMINRNWVRWLVPSTIDVSNQEIVPAKAELTKMEPLWTDIKCKVIIMQGGKDVLVPPGNADYAETMLKNASSVEVIRLPAENHFIPFTKPELVTEALLRF